MVDDYADPTRNTYAQSYCQSQQGNGQLFYAYGDFCEGEQRSNYLILSIMCGRSDTIDGVEDSPDKPIETEYSRTFLLDVSDIENVQYYDLTLAVEISLDKELYTWESYGGDCYEVVVE